MIKEQTSAAYFRAFNILFIALVTGQVMLAVIFYILSNIAGKTMPAQEQRVFLYVAAIIMFAALAFNQFVLSKRTEAIKQQPLLAEQLNSYRALYIMRLALAEAPTLFAIILVFVTGNQLLWLLVGIGLVYSISLRPSKERLIRELEISGDDIDKLNDPDAVVANMNARNY